MQLRGFRWCPTCPSAFGSFVLASIFHGFGQCLRVRVHVDVRGRHIAFWFSDEVITEYGLCPVEVEDSENTLLDSKVCIRLVQFAVVLSAEPKDGFAFYLECQTCTTDRFDDDPVL